MAKLLHRHSAITPARRSTLRFNFAGRAALIASVCVAACGLGADADTVNPYMRLLMRTKGAALNSTTAPADSASRAAKAPLRAEADVYRPTQYLPVMLRVATPTTPVPDFVNELHRRGTIVLATVENTRIADLDGAEGIVRVEANSVSKADMVDARKFCHLPEVAASPELPTGLTGKGVVTGFCDIGFDPNHINFRTIGGVNRVKKIVNYTYTYPRPTVYKTIAGISAWSTDNVMETHATHVCGIMAGGYDKYDLRGIATCSDIVATTSPLTDVHLLDGCEEIIDYAKEKGKPAVINMSISSMTGPHDGTTLFNQYISAMTEDATICISTANSGNMPGFLKATLTDAKPFVRTFPRGFPSMSLVRIQGKVDIWSSDSEPLTVQIMQSPFKSSDEDPVVPIGPKFDPASGEREWVICSPEYDRMYGDAVKAHFPKHISGYIYLAADVNPENGRFNIMAEVNYLDNTTTSSSNARSFYALEVGGHPQAEVEMYSSDRLMLTAYGDKQASYGTTNRTINDFCCSEGVIAVGSFDSQDTQTFLSGTVTPFPKLHIGGPSYYSCFGTLNDGTVLPTVCAPGAQVVSSLSTPYLSRFRNDIPSEASFRVPVLNTPATPADDSGNSPAKVGVTPSRPKSEWYWGPMQGTSMSTPYVAGVCALWLEAAPNLNGRQIREVVMKSASTPTVDPSNPQWGGGVLNAAEGLKLAREMSRVLGVETVAAPDDSDPSAVAIRSSQGRVQITSLASPVAQLTVVTPDGVTLHSESPMAHDVNLDLSGASSSIALLRLTLTDGTVVTRKLALR